MPHLKFFALRSTVLCALAAALTLSGLSPNLAAAPASTSADLIVYGGTASGIMTAFAAAHQGLHVILLEPGSHLGGMVTGGLSATDLGNFHVIGGYARDFYMRAAAQYGADSNGFVNLDQPASWRSEPHVDLAIFNGMLAHAHVQVHLHARLRERHGVQLAGTRVVSITTEDGKRWHAAVFADCTYEGDLMAQSGVHYTVGREPSSQYDESLAGVRDHTPGHQFRWFVSRLRRPTSSAAGDRPRPTGRARFRRQKVQAYNFRLILTTDPADRLPFPSRGLQQVTLRLLARYISEFPAHAGRAPSPRHLPYRAYPESQGRLQQQRALSRPTTSAIAGNIQRHPTPRRPRSGRSIFSTPNPTFTSSPTTASPPVCARR